MEQQPEIRGSDLLVGIESELRQQVDRALPDMLDLVFGRRPFDLDELPEVGHGIEADRISIKRVELAVLFDSRRGLEAEPRENPRQGLLVVDGRLVFLPCFRFGLDQRPFICEFGGGFAVCGLFVPDAECFVGLGELAVGCVVVGIRLCAAVDVIGAVVSQHLTEFVVVSSEFEFDLVHS